MLHPRKKFRFSAAYNSICLKMKKTSLRRVKDVFFSFNELFI